MTDITDLKAQIQAVTKENDDIKSDFKYLVFKDTQLSDNAWKAFVSKVDTASNKIDQVTQSLEVYKQSKAPISVAAKEDPNSKISSEILTDYTNLYERIKSALMDGDKLKSDLTSNYDNVLKGIQGDDNNTPTYSFIEAIKSNSLNSKAKIIQSFEGGVDADINYYLLKAVLTNLVPDAINQLVSSDSSIETVNSLNQLLGILVKMLNKPSSDLFTRISSSYHDNVKPPKDIQGGSFSSSMSKKNRKSHKSYHPGIGKTKKHHHSHHKKISFVH
jgi:hypothetical protein